MASNLPSWLSLDLKSTEFENLIKEQTIALMDSLVLQGLLKKIDAIYSFNLKYMSGALQVNGKQITGKEVLPPIVSTYLQSMNTENAAPEAAKSFPPPTISPVK